MLSFTRDLGNKQMLSGQKLMMPNNALEIYSGQQLERNNFTKSFLNYTDPFHERNYSLKEQG